MITQSEYQMNVRLYIAHKQAEGLRESTLLDLTGRLDMIGRECGFNTLDDINAPSVETLFAKLGEIDPATGKSIRAPSTRVLLWKYGYGFFEWLIVRGKLSENPVHNAPRPKKLKRDLRKKRRPLTDQEIENLFKVARFRPLAEYAKMRLVGSRDPERWKENPITTQNVEFLANECRQMLNQGEVRKKEIDGIKWYLIYKSLIYTGLRWGELRSITIAQMKLGKNSTIELESSDSKNGNEATIRLNPELADELGQWILDRKLGLSSKLFDMPSKGMKRFTYDALGAGIEMLDSRGRSVDVHALRHTFGSMLVRSGVNAKVCQEAMRHSNISLTMDI